VTSHPSLSLLSFISKSAEGRESVVYVLGFPFIMNPTTMAAPVTKPLYSPLGLSETRLLTLLPGNEEDRAIRCTLKHATLKIETARDIQYWRLQESLSRSKAKRLVRRLSRFGQPAYEALSYCWGSDEAYDSIDINGHQVSVGRNLWMALHHLRYPAGGKKRALWVDAICVNQRDLAERSAQVAVMYAIYNRASEVIIWLGEEYDESDYALEAIAASTQLDSERTFRPEAQKAIWSLYNRPYWGRLWILQEVCLAEKLRLCCGWKSIPWDHFDHFWMHFRHFIQSAASDKRTSLQRSYLLPESLEKLMDMTHRRTCFSGMLHLLQVSRHLQCSDIRDRVFGLVGLLHQRLGSDPLQADYSINLQQLYVDVMEWYVKNEANRCEDVLSMSQVLRDALGPPFLQTPETGALFHCWKSVPYHIRPKIGIMASDHVTCIGPLLRSQPSPWGMYLDLHILHEEMPGNGPDATSRPSDSEALEAPKEFHRAVYQRMYNSEDKEVVKRILDFEGQCCAFVSADGAAFLGSPNVKLGDGICCMNKDDEKELWIIRLADNESTSSSPGMYGNTTYRAVEIMGPAFRFREPAVTTFLPELEKASQAVLDDSSEWNQSLSYYR
jgi:hypothetical protein